MVDGSQSKWSQFKVLISDVSVCLFVEYHGLRVFDDCLETQAIGLSEKENRIQLKQNISIEKKHRTNSMIDMFVYS